MTEPADRQYRFLLYAPQNGADLAAEIGRADYSYFFVMRYFAPVLEQLGPTVVLSDPHETPEPAPGREDVRLLFLPPHSIPLDLPEPGIPVFAWEYDAIPTDPWEGEPRHDWRVVLRSSLGAVTHSEFAVAAVRRAMGPDFPVVSLPAPVWDRYAALYEPDRPAVLSPWQLDVPGVVMDSRQLVQPDGELAEPDTEFRNHTVDLGGVVYTAVANPNDGRKNWDDLVTAFVWAFRDNPDATLVVKLVHFDAAQACKFAYANMARLAPYRCRIVAIHAFLETDAYQQLIKGTSFAVNSSRGEGQCLPLMEFMSAGVPALAPDHTAMAQYVNRDNSFVVPWTREWTHWPHDPRRFLRCFTFWPKWDALCQAYVDSFDLIRTQPDDYQRMRAAASASLQRYCSEATVAGGMTDLLASLSSRSERSRSQRSQSQRLRSLSQSKGPAAQVETTA